MPIKTIITLPTILTLLLVSHPLLTQNTVEADSHRVDLRVEHLNSIFANMNPGDVSHIELADDSYYELEKSDDNTLNAQVMLYSPGEQKYKAAFNGTYVWNDQASSLIAEVCKEHPIELKNPEVNTDCEEGIMKASGIIGLEVTGSVLLEGYQSENLEKCLAVKLPPKTIEKPYMRCMIKVLGDKKYAAEAVAAKIKEMENQGYECDKNGECFKAEDPQVFADLMESLKGKPVQIAVPNDDRPRYCDLKSHPLMANLPDDRTDYLESFQYSCNYWVNNIFCKQVEDRMFFAVQYIDNAGHEEIFFTHPFNISSAQKVNIDWRNKERIHFATFFSEKHTLTVQEMEFEFSTGRKDSCKLTGSAAVNRADLNQIKVGLAGEIAGFEYAKLAKGIRIKNVIERN